MKAANLFYGMAFLMLAYLVSIPSFKIPIIPGWLDAPIPNPLHLFHPLNIVFAILAIICFVTAFPSTSQKTQSVIKKRKPRIPRRMPDSSGLGIALLALGIIIVAVAVYMATTSA